MGIKQEEKSPTEGVDDTFSKTWGAQTKWKTGLPRGRRFGPSDRLDSVEARAHPGNPQCTPQLDKPLPPLPLQDLVQSEDRLKDVAETSDSPNAQPRPSTSTSSSSVISIFRLARRMGVSRKPKLAKQLPAEPQSSINVEVQPFAIPTYNYEDKGTQTTDDLLKIKPSWRNLIPFSPHGFLHGSENGSIHSDSNASPLWSPRRFLATTAPGDYFFSSLASEKKHSLEVSSQKSGSSTETQIRVPLDDSHSSLHQGHLLGRSKDSLGSYESRYSSKNIEDIKEAERPTLTRKANSESTLPSALKSIPEANDQITVVEPGIELQGDRNATRKSVAVAEGQQRPHSPSFRAHHRHQSSPIRKLSRSLSPFSQDQSPQTWTKKSTGSSPSSSLRQEFRAMTNDAESPEASSHTHEDYFRMPVGVSSTLTPPPPVVDLDIPDHLLTSPLCPRHPKHRSGGTGVCPLHGRNKTSLSESSGSGGSQGSAEKAGALAKDTTPTQKHMPGEFRDGDSAWDSIANSNSIEEDESLQVRRNWVYLFHPRWVEHISEDSISRLPIR